MKKIQPEYFVSLDDSDEFRKNLLGVSRDVIVSMQKYEQFKIVRIKKYENITRLKHIMSEIEGLVVKLKEICPTAGVREKPVSEFMEKLHERQDYEHSSEITKDNSDYSTDLKKLEKELSKIESQLNVLG